MNNIDKNNLNKEPTKSSIEYPLISIVIPTYNRVKMLKDLIESIKQSSYPSEKIEIIVVDDNSSDGTSDFITSFFPEIVLVRNKRNMLQSYGRQIGMSKSNGEFILFIDDDNVIDRSMLGKLITFMENNMKCGICSPLMLYHNSDLIWFAGSKRNMYTGLTKYLFHKDKISQTELPECIETDDAPNCFIVRKRLVDELKVEFDYQTFPRRYEESDFIYKIRKAGYSAICFTMAIEWHKIRDIKMQGFESEDRVYNYGRSRVLFHYKYSSNLEFLIFSLFFNPLIAIFYVWQFFFHFHSMHSLKMIKSYFRGLLHAYLKIMKVD